VAIVVVVMVFGVGMLGSVCVFVDGFLRLCLFGLSMFLRLSRCVVLVVWVRVCVLVC